MKLIFIVNEKSGNGKGAKVWRNIQSQLSVPYDVFVTTYEKEAINSNWSVREMKRQINTFLYERLLLSKGDLNKEQVLALATNGVEISDPADIIKDPYVFEFLGIPEDKPVMESDLEKALVEQIEKFLLQSTHIIFQRRNNSLPRWKR